MAHPRSPTNEGAATATGSQVYAYEVPGSWERLNADLITHLETLDATTDWSPITTCYLKLSAKPSQLRLPSSVTASTLRQVKSTQLRDDFVGINTAFLSHIKTQDMALDWTNTAWEHLEHSMMIWRDIDELSFLDLPPELREMIYSYVVTPEMAESHVKENKVPSLLNVSQMVREDFARFYYGRKVFTVKFYNSSTKVWEDVVDSIKVQAMFECWKGSAVFEHPYNLAGLKRHTELWEDPWCRYFRAVLTWIGASPNVGFGCYLVPDATRDIRHTRLEAFLKRRAQKKKEKELVNEFGWVY